MMLLLAAQLGTALLLTWCWPGPYRGLVLASRIALSAEILLPTAYLALTHRL